MELPIAREFKRPVEAPQVVSDFRLHGVLEDKVGVLEEIENKRLMRKSIRLYFRIKIVLQFLCEFVVVFLFRR